MAYYKTGKSTVTGALLLYAMRKINISTNGINGGSVGLIAYLFYVPDHLREGSIGEYIDTDSAWEESYIKVEEVSSFMADYYCLQEPSEFKLLYR